MFFINFNYFYFSVNIFIGLFGLVVIQLMNSKMATALYKVVYVTVPSTEVGKNIAKEIIQKRLAACVNIVPHLTSIYEWKGKIEEESESLLIIKTEADRLVQLEEIVNKIHPYDVPEFIVLPIEKGSEPYLKWIYKQTRNEIENVEDK
ncbi:unnamed protein product [Meloidogyne enterolobii]|uniref:Uncharacterized protein n=1 Tax=Meloidogyne enterolobii TaxID=390850 RepID=A0ACB0Z422_MELEN